MSDFSRRVAAACHARCAPATQVSSAHCPPIIARIDDGKHLDWRTMSGNQCDWRTKGPGRGREERGGTPHIRPGAGGRARHRRTAAPPPDTAAARRREGHGVAAAPYHHHHHLAVAQPPPPTPGHSFLAAYRLQVTLLPGIHTHTHILAMLPQLSTQHSSYTPQHSWGAGGR